MLNIIYYIWINIKRNYFVIIEGQLDDILKSKITNNSKLFIIICCEHDDLIDNIEKIINNKLQNKIIYELEFKKENYYEYYGINKLYSLALLEPTSYFLYFHSKGMFNYTNTNVNERFKYELSLTRETINKCKEVINLFENNSNIMKIGLFPSDKLNFYWFNFYYARGEYLITCEKPILTTNRYYYETWSGTGNNNMGLEYNLYENNYIKYSQQEVISKIHHMKI